MKKVIIIPARIGSTRLARKVLLDLNGKSVIERVFNQCTKIKDVDVYIATDAYEVFNTCKFFTDNVIMTRLDHESGTDRIAEVAHKIDCDLVVNVQGDEPFIDPSLIKSLFNAFENDETTMVTAMEKIDNFKDLKNPNVVKVIVDNNLNAIYFSRSIIPNVRDNFDNDSDADEIIKNQSFYKHIGVYAYKKDFLINYSKLPQTSYEKLERLEQLRIIQNGFKIKMIETQIKSIGIDTLEDLNKAKKYLKNE